MYKNIRLWMKTFIAFPGLILLAFPPQVTVADAGACFLVASSGRTINLGKLCGLNPFRQWGNSSSD